MSAPSLSGALRDELAGLGLLAPERMLLFWSSRSPYVRKVTIAAHEHGLFDRLILAPVSITLLAGSPLLRRINPLGQIPTLVTPEGDVLFDSAVIVEYLDTIGHGPALVPHDPAARIEALGRHALVHGLMDAMLAWRSERNRADATKDARREAYRAKIEAVFAALEAQAAAWPESRFDIGDIALASALDYARFRDVVPDWPQVHPRLADRQAAISERPSVASTAFHDPAEPA
jgi:glutathione S-transferase